MITESLEDLRKHYRSTYVFLEIEGKKHLTFYGGDNEEEFIFQSPTFGDLLVNTDTVREKLTFLFPKAGLYNLNNGVYDFTRNPARQWRKAPCGDNTRFRGITDSITLRAVPKIHFSFDIAEHIFFPKYPRTTEEAVQNIPKDGIALNRNIGITIAPEKYDAEHILWYRQAPVGTLDSKKKEITVKYQPLYQEIYDYYTKKEPQWKIHLTT